MIWFAVSWRLGNRCVDLGRFQDEFRPFRRGEVALARRAQSEPDFLPEAERHLLRYAVRLAQLSSLGPESDLLTDRLGSFRLRLLQLLAPHLPTDPGGIDAAALQKLAPRIRHLVEGARGLVAESAVASAEALDDEVCRKDLVLVMGGAGAAGFVFLGALRAFEEAGLRPNYILGTSIGAVVGALRARTNRFDLEGLLSQVARIGVGKLFRPPATPGRYGLPGALRLDLKGGLGWFFSHGDGSPVRLSELRIPFDTMVCGLGAGALTHERGEYADLLGEELHDPEEFTHLRSATIMRAVAALIELAVSRRMFVQLQLGGGPETAQLEALDAAGFSAAIPALLQYDVIDADPHTERVLNGLFERHKLVALVDGSIGQLLPAQRAWQTVESGRLGHRNCAIVALDALVAARGRNRVLAPLQRALAATVQRDRAFWDLYVPYPRAPFVLDLVPRDSLLRRAADDGYEQTRETAELLRGLLAPLPRWEAIASGIPEWRR